LYQQSIANAIANAMPQLNPVEYGTRLEPGAGMAFSP
jgi:hypothetical protein